MRGAGKRVNRQHKRGQAVAYGCYLPDADPDPLDIDRDGEEVERLAEEEARREAGRLVRAVKNASHGLAAVGEWDVAAKSGSPRRGKIDSG